MSLNKEKNFVSAVVYLYNNEREVAGFLNTVNGLLKENFEKYEIICVNDCSTDNTVKAVEAFCEENAFWLDDYALFMALKNAFGGISWHNWETGIRNREEAAIAKAKADYAEDILFWKVLQYFFFKQWKQLREYVNGKGIKFI